METKIPTLPSDVSNPYKILDVLSSATEKEIRKAYRKKARNIHPDKNPNDPYAEQRFLRLQRVYEFLIHRTARQEYDDKVMRGEARKIQFSRFSEARKHFVEDLEKRERNVKRFIDNKTKTGNCDFKEQGDMEKARENNEQWIAQKKHAKQRELSKQSREASCNLETSDSNPPRGYLEVSWTPASSTPGAASHHVSHETLVFLFSSFGVPRVVQYDVSLGKSIIELESREKNLEAGLHFLNNRHRYPFFVKFRKESFRVPESTPSIPNAPTVDNTSSTQNVSSEIDLSDLTAFEASVMGRLKEAMKRQKMSQTQPH